MVSDPKDRLKLDKIVNHQYLSGPEEIPLVLPVEFLHMEPSKEWISKLQLKTEIRKSIKEKVTNTAEHY